MLSARRLQGPKAKYPREAVETLVRPAVNDISSHKIRNKDDKEAEMRDYSNMPKLEWHDDKGTLAKIKTQLMREEPVILVMPAGFDFNLDAPACDCHEASGVLTECQANKALSILAEQNNVPNLQEVGNAASTAGMTLDINPTEGYLVIHD